jgi:hypothetical protein
VEPEPQPHGNLNLTVQTRQPSWVRVTADNKIVFEGTLTAGEKRQWAAQDTMGVTIGYAPGVQVTLNGKPVNVLSEARNDVSDLFFRKEDVGR